MRRILRRSFLATLLAPLLAKFAPKPDAPKEVWRDGTAWITMGTDSAKGEDRTVIVVYECTPTGQGHYWREVFFKSSAQPGQLMYWTKPQDPTTWEDVDWKDLA